MMPLLWLWACTAEKSDTAGDSGRDTADTGDTGGTGDSGDSGDSTDSGDSADSGDSGGDSGETGDSGSPTPALDALLAALRADLDGTMVTVSRDSGWPAPVEGGYLFVETGPGSWSWAGDADDWAGEAMARDAGFSWIVVPAAPGDGYKFTDGTTWAPDPWARSYTYDTYGELSLVTPDGMGHLERQYAVEGEGLQPRTLHLWVPGGTVDHVLYMEDGQNLFDPTARWGGWRLDESVPDGMLIVGIDNTGDRMEEYTHDADLIHGTWYGGWGATYADYLQGTVRPLVQDIYGERGPVGLLGSSLGGLISFYVADQYPGEYRFAGSMSGTMGWGSIGASNETMIEIYRDAGHRDTALYLDSGGYGGCYDADGDGIEDDDPNADDNYCENAQMRDVLNGIGYEFDVDLWHWWEPDATHDEAAWAARVWRPLEIFADL